MGEEVIGAQAAGVEWWEVRQSLWNSFLSGPFPQNLKLRNHRSLRLHPSQLQAFAVRFLGNKVVPWLTVSLTWKVDKQEGKGPFGAPPGLPEEQQE